MKLHDLVEAYIDYKRSLGMRLRSQAAVLRSYCRRMGDICVDEVKAESVLAFVAGTGPVTTRWFETYTVLAGLYQYAISRGFTTKSPLPVNLPHRPPPFAAYVYTVDELERLLAATDLLQSVLSPMLALTMRTTLLLLYGTGMRIGEALSLTLQDVDLGEHLITVRDTKFFKTRLVPIGPRLGKALRHYHSCRCTLPLPAGANSAFLATHTGIHLNYKRVNKLFCRIREAAGIRRQGARYQPRLHDIRHTAAVHRVIGWYRAGANVQALLPKLATYLGHLDIRSTQCYLSMTSELLQEASFRFERYANQEVCHA
ncbi:tyrosine-type recombinase/integrase [Rhodoferax sp.]|uniref:tyrosine-type recombinase/integrase n=1 Tax=Rhodoferax sp. TaxID=50421 RepID=UPI002633A568|nr:tyrosine-type recombinase/integrase [Rhodoferax sp.]MDD2808944.1 tyrosine-type recombinase/integrase [Rhodoferax sp.]